MITLDYNVSFSWRRAQQLFFPHNFMTYLQKLLSRFCIGFRVVIMQTPKTHFYVIWKQSYATLPCSGGHFEFCPLAANAQGEIQGTFSMLLRWGAICNSLNSISPLFVSDQNDNFTGSNFGEITSCVTIIVVIKFKCHCILVGS